MPKSFVDRLNSEGFMRHELQWILQDRKTVHAFRKLNQCLLCRSPGVNEAALCTGCWAVLDDAEYEVANQWLIGVRQ